MFDRNSPIGVLDSGIGGFSVARRVQQLLPGEDLLYFGDGAHIPYGNHPEQTIVAMARYMFDFMQNRGVKALLVACNTISCVLPRCADAVSCAAFNAVQAGAEGACRMEGEKVGVISTVFTHNARCYPEHILARDPGRRVVLSCGCPDLARLVEHNLGNPAGMAAVEENLKLELDGLVAGGICCLVLGCTHYPLVEDSIRRLYPGLPLVDPAEEMARSLKDHLEREDLLRRDRRLGGLSIYTTGDVQEYALRAGQVGLERVEGVYPWPALEI